MDYIIVFCTCPNEEIGRKIAEKLVTDKIAACVNIVPGLESIYRWQGQICKDKEMMLIIKSSSDKYNQLENSIRAIHPYETPEIIAVTISNGYEKYLEWISENIENGVTI